MPMPSLTTHHAPDSGTDGARTHDLPHVKRTLIPAELRFHPLAFFLAANKSHYIVPLVIMQVFFLNFFSFFYAFFKALFYGPFFIAFSPGAFFRSLFPGPFSSRFISLFFPGAFFRFFLPGLYPGFYRPFFPFLSSRFVLFLFSRFL